MPRMHGKRIRWTVATVVGIVVGVIIVASEGCALASSERPDLSSWTEQRLRFSGSELVFRVPGGRSRDIPEYQTIPYVDLDASALGPTGRGLAVFERHWSYRRAPWDFLGSLRMYVSVNLRPPDYGKDLMSLDNLRELRQREIDELYGPRYEALRRKEETESTMMTPAALSRVTLRNTEWLVYSLGGEQFWRATGLRRDSIGYICPLTSSRYLTVGFSFVHGPDKQSTWRQEAQTVVDRIVASVELKRRD